MHEHFTDAALRVLEWAYFEANALCAATTRPEHLLIGLAVEPGTFLRRVMDSREIQISELRRAVAEAGLDAAPAPVPVKPPIGAELRQVLEHARQAGMHQARDAWPHRH